jgi:hypothetical protein
VTISGRGDGLQDRMAIGRASAVYVRTMTSSEVLTPWSGAGRMPKGSSLLGRGDKRNPQSEKDGGDSEPYRSP